jgi:RNA polymerase sigma-70 factor, ECF subfamily
VLKAEAMNPFRVRGATGRPDQRVDRGRAAGGDDEELVALLYQDYYTPLLAFTMRLTAGNRQWAEDVVQETLLRAWRNADQLDPEARSLMPWLGTVARRIVIDDRRRLDARPAEVAHEPPEVPVDDQTERLVRTVTVTEALQALSPAHREVLVETFLKDKTVNQAADTLGVPVGTVKSRVYYALRALRLALNERGVTVP